MSDRDKPQSLRERFDAKWTRSTDTACWIWQGVQNGKGYGQFKLDGKMRLAHRIAFELYKGEIPERKMVCHLCDVPACVNPDHLFLGTNSENIKDSYDKGRSNQRGELNGNSLLTDRQVRQIRESRKTYRDIAAEFGISKSQVGNIRKGIQWTK